MLSSSINELATALSKAQAKIEGALADSPNPFFKSKYADLASVWKSIRTPFTDNGLSVSQVTQETQNGTELITILMHSSGQYVMGSLKIRTTKDDAQGLVAGMTYARRATLSAISGVAQIDDDGNMASGRTDTKSVPQNTTKVQNCGKVEDNLSQPPVFPEDDPWAEEENPKFQTSKVEMGEVGTKELHPNLHPDLEMKSGKYTGKKFSWILDNAIDYVIWANGQPKKGQHMQQLVNYCLSRGAKL